MSALADSYIGTAPAISRIDPVNAGINGVIDTTPGSFFKARAKEIAGNVTDQVVPQRRETGAQTVERGVGQDADLAVLQGDRSARVVVVRDSVESQDFAREVIPRDLLSAVFGQDDRLERAEAHSVQRGETITLPEQVRLALDAQAHSDEIVELLEFAGVEPARQAKAMHHA